MKYIIKYYCENAGTYYWIEDVTKNKLEEEVMNLHFRDIKISDIKVYEVQNVVVDLKLNFKVITGKL